MVEDIVSHKVRYLKLLYNLIYTAPSFSHYFIIATNLSDSPLPHFPSEYSPYPTHLTSIFPTNHSSQNHSFLLSFPLFFIFHSSPIVLLIILIVSRLMRPCKMKSITFICTLWLRELFSYWFTPVNLFSSNTFLSNLEIYMNICIRYIHYSFHAEMGNKLKGLSAWLHISYVIKGQWQDLV